MDQRDTTTGDWFPEPDDYRQLDRDLVEHHALLIAD